jgi:uncharacterized membrane protein
MAAEIIVLRVVHLVAGGIWVGTAVFVAALLMPSLVEAGPAGGSVMAALQKRRITAFLPAAAVLTLLSGLRLLWIDSAGFDASYFRSGIGGAFGLGAVLALTAFIIGMAVTRPSMNRAAVLSDSLPSTPEADRGALVDRIRTLRARGAAGGNLIAILVVLAMAAMSVARYL